VSLPRRTAPYTRHTKTLLVWANGPYLSSFANCKKEEDIGFGLLGILRKAILFPLRMQATFPECGRLG
jgi:hypothetical protein